MLVLFIDGGVIYWCHLQVSVVVVVLLSNGVDINDASLMTRKGYKKGWGFGGGCFVGQIVANLPRVL